MHKSICHALPTNGHVNLALDVLDEEESAPRPISSTASADDRILVQTLDYYDEDEKRNGLTDGVDNLTSPYDPYEHRNLDHALSYNEALCHMIKGSLGTGILTMPHAFKNAGYLMGFFATLVIGAFTTYCIQKLVRAQHEICRRTKVPSMTYPQILGAAFNQGPEKFRWFASYGTFFSFVVLVMDEVGALCVYVLFVSDNMRQVCLPLTQIEDLRLYIISLFPILLLLGWLPNLKNMVPLSTGATGVMGASLGITLYYMLQDVPPLSERRPVGTVQEFPLFLGVTLFSLSSIGVTMPLENEMREPKRLSTPLGVLNVASGISAVVFAMFGLLGYLKYGENIEGSITLNLPEGTDMTLLVQIMLSGAVLLTFPLPHFIVYDIVWNQFFKLKISIHSRTSSIVLDYLIRSFLVLITVSLAILIPNLELFVSLIGALCLGVMTLIIPAIVDILTFLPLYKHGLERILFMSQNVGIILLGIFISATGVYFSIKKLLSV